MPFPYLTVQPLSAGVSLFIVLYPPDLAIRSGTESIHSMFLQSLWIEFMNFIHSSASPRQKNGHESSRFRRKSLPVENSVREFLSLGRRDFVWRIQGSIRRDNLIPASQAAKNRLWPKCWWMTAGSMAREPTKNDTSIWAAKEITAAPETSVSLKSHSTWLCNKNTSNCSSTLQLYTLHAHTHDPMETS